MQQEQDLMIRVRDVKKKYRLGQIGGGTLRGDLQSWWARKRGKEDPNTLIGTDQRLVGTTFMALNGVSFEVKKGEAVGIIGSNGAGKSTLLKLLTHVTAPTEGDIDLYGRVASMLEVGTGFHPEMTGRENVYLNGAILGMTRAEIDAKMDEIIEFSEVGDFIDTPVKRYSSGMYVKLAFSVAAHLDSEIMIMDEVLAVGDMKFQQKCLTKMRENATQQGRTILYVSHNMNTIRQLCDRCIVLNKGRIIFSGDVEKAISVYLGTRMNGQVITECDNFPRESICSGLLRMTKIEMQGKEQPVYINDEPMNLYVHYNAQKSMDDLLFRVSIFSEQGEPVGMCCTREEFSARCGKNITSFRLNLGTLAQGNYTGRLAFYESNQYGREVVHDVVDKIFAFKKEYVGAVTSTTNQWNRRAWGNISFPAIQTMSIDSGKLDKKQL